MHSHLYSKEYGALFQRHWILSLFKRWGKIKFIDVLEGGYNNNVNC